MQSKKSVGQVPKLDFPEGFTDREKIFVTNYLVSFNSASAARKAGHKCEYFMGSALLRKPHIADFVRRAIDERVCEDLGTRERILKELRYIAFGNMSDIAQWDEEEIKFKPSKNLTPKQRAIVDSLSSTPGEFGFSKSIKRVDKMKAIELLGKYYGMWKKVDEDESGNGEELKNSVINAVSDAFQRVKKSE